MIFYDKMCYKPNYRNKRGTNQPDWYFLFCGIEIFLYESEDIHRRHGIGINSRGRLKKSKETPNNLLNAKNQFVVEL